MEKLADTLWPGLARNVRRGRDLLNSIVDLVREQWMQRKSCVRLLVTAPQRQQPGNWSRDLNRVAAC
jgi:hypothetical protein